MKKYMIIVAVLFASVTYASVDLAPECQAKFMQDPCSVDGYAMVEIEEFVAGGHNQMYDIHHHASRKVSKKRRRVARKGYKVVKKCRYVKVRR
jgi:hypothetical protein